MAFAWGLGPATDRILKRYGSRSGSIINATGTGTQIVLTSANTNSQKSGEAVNRLENLLGSMSPKGDGKVPITALAGNGEPLRFLDTEPVGKRLALDRTILTYGRDSTYDVDLTVIGNSLDYYRLTILYKFFQNIGKYGYTGDMPLIDMKVVPNSAPGMCLNLYDGSLVRGSIGINIGGNAKISDKTFTLSFHDADMPSWSLQGYEQDASPAWYEELIAF